MINLIKDIYDKAGITENESSINKIIDIKNAIPTSNLISRTHRRQIVFGMIDVMNLDGEIIVSDAEKRITALNNAASEISTNVTELRKISNQTIASLESQIRDIRQDQSAKELEGKSKAAEINAELTKVVTAKDFVS